MSDNQTQLTRFLELMKETFPRIDRNDLVSLLECPVCRDMLSPPISLCTNGHSMCGQCGRNLLVCGLCRATIQISRNITVERILEHTTVYCSNITEGCPVTLSASNLKDHEAECDYRAINCTVSSATKKCRNTPVEYTRYNTHIRDVHKLDSMDDNYEDMKVRPFPTKDNRFRVHFYDENINSVDVGAWPSVYFTFDGSTFIVRSILALGVFYTWASVIGTRRDATKYKINMTLLHHIQNDKEEGSNTTDKKSGASSRNHDLISKLGSCGCSCKYEGETRFHKEFLACHVFTAHVQKPTDLEGGESPLGITLNDLPKDKIKISLTRKRKYKEEIAKLDSLFSWSIIYHTYKVDESLRPQLDSEKKLSDPSVVPTIINIDDDDDDIINDFSPLETDIDAIDEDSSVMEDQDGNMELKL